MQHPEHVLPSRPLPARGPLRLHHQKEQKGHLQHVRHITSLQLVTGLPDLNKEEAKRHLNLAYCNNLVSFPETICRLKALIFLSCSGCSQLNSFPEILENMENSKELSVNISGFFCFNHCWEKQIRNSKHRNGTEIDIPYFWLLTICVYCIFDTIIKLSTLFTGRLRFNHAT